MVLQILAFILLITLHGVLPVDVNYTGGHWSYGTPLLPRRAHSMAVGQWNGSLFMIGGAPYGSKSLVEYNIMTHEMVDYGTSYLSTDTFNNGQFWSQQSQNVYMIDSDEGTSFSVFDLSTKTFTPTWNGVHMNIEGGDRGCLASTVDYLFIVGGSALGRSLDDLQVLDVNLLEWRANTPSIAIKRENAGCIVRSEYLYVIGGRNKNLGDTGYPIQSIEKININHLEEWKQSEYPLLISVTENRAILFADDILSVGGYTGSPGAIVPVKSVQVIHGVTDMVTMAVDMEYVIGAAGTIKVGHTLYVFGGYDGSYQNKWQYYNLPDTISPTAVPSTLPSTAPITTTFTSPSAAPSAITPVSPTISPSNKRSLQPSINPSKHPTQTALATMISSTDNRAYDGGVHNSKNPELILSVVIGIISVIVLSFVVIVGFYICYKKRKETDNMHHVRLTNVANNDERNRVELI